MISRLMRSHDRAGFHPVVLDEVPEPRAYLCRDRERQCGGAAIAPDGPAGVLGQLVTACERWFVLGARKAVGQNCRSALRVPVTLRPVDAKDDR